MNNSNIKIFCDIDGVILPLQYNNNLAKHYTYNNYLYYHPIIVPFIKYLNNNYNLSWLSYREDESIIVNSLFEINIPFVPILNNKINTINYYSKNYQHIIWIDDENNMLSKDNLPKNVIWYKTDGNYGIIEQDVKKIYGIIDNLVL